MESQAMSSDHVGINIERIGALVLRYGLALILIWVGGLKFTAYEAKGIEPLVAHSPFLAWAYHILGTEGISMLLGCAEILFGVLICLRPVNAKLSAYGSVASVVMFLITLSLLLSTPGVIAQGYPFPVLSANVGQFIAKDLVLLGAALWTAGEALSASRKPEIDSANRNTLGRAATRSN